MLTRMLHISDLHIGQDEEEDINFDLIVDHIIQKGKDVWMDNKPMVIVTGDLVNDGEEVQFLHARNYLYRLQNAGFVIRLIPGNHDYGKKGNWAKTENYENFKKYFTVFHKIEYPFYETINGHFLIGLNSMNKEADGFDAIFADGELGAGQIKDAVRLIDEYKEQSDGKIIVYLHHHPFLFPDEGPLKKIGERVGHWLKDGKEFMEKIKSRKIDILLFGHEHRHLKFENTGLNNKYSIRHIVSSGKSTEKSYEYPVLQDGTAKTPAYKSEETESVSEDHLEAYEFGPELLEEENNELLDLPNGFLGRLIEIDDGGNISVENEIFEKKPV